MDSLRVLKHQIIVFDVCGVWPPENSPCSYYWKTIIFSLTLLFPISQLACVFYVDSINEMVDHLIITSSCAMTLIKGYNIIAQRKHFTVLFKILKKMDKETEQFDYKPIFMPIFKDCRRLFRTFVGAYLTAWGFVLLQVLWSSPAKRLWPSTHIFPSEFLHKPSVYYGVIVFQAFSNFCFCVLNACIDTYGPILLYILSGHLHVLSIRMQSLGHTKIDESQEKLLIQYCMNYVLFLRSSIALQYILSFSLLVQFGVSGVVLCTCAYQLSVVDPADVLKFIFTVFYSLCMISEIFFPCYFGSLLTARSDTLPYDTFKSNWINQNRRYKQSQMILVEKTLKPIKAYAAGVFVLSLSTLLSILKTAYSLFALLKNVQNY